MRLHSFFQYISGKLPLAAALAAIGPRAFIEGAFVLLIFLDCFTRLTAISHGRLVARGEAAGLLASIRGIPAARRDHLIMSGVMRRRGVEKLILYHIVLLTAAAVDFLARGSGIALFPMTSAYLSMTEALSILENLSDAGVKNIGGLISRMKRK